MSRLPPYARELAQARSAGQPINLFCYVGDNAWRYAAQRPAGNRLAVPPDLDWRAADFSAIAGLEVLVLARGWERAELDEFATLLVRQGATLVAGVLVVHAKQGRAVEMTYYRRARRSARAA